MSVLAPDRQCERCGARLRRSKSIFDTLCDPCEAATRPPVFIEAAPADDPKGLCKTGCGEPVLKRSGSYAYLCARCRDRARGLDA